MSLFITFEGGEGSGKTSLIKEIEKKLKQNNILNLVLTREPGGIKISESIRSILLDKKNTMMDPRTEALLFAASRRQHLIEKIIPALKEDKIVICDRFIDSSFVYQGLARNIGIDKIIKINNFAIEDYMPDLTFLLDIDPVIGLERINQNKNREVNRLDLEKLDFHKKIRDGYLSLIKLFPKRIILINANKTIEELSNKVLPIILNKLKEI